MNQIQALIINAVTTSNNNQFRKQAQQTLFTLFTCNPTDFFQNCAFLITDISRPDVNRQAVASVMKALLQKKTDKNQFYWDAVEPSKRPDIKTCLFNNLVSENRIVMRAGANVIAGIAAIENPRGQWLDLINMLASNTRHQSQNIRIASLTTLGYICEELKNSRINFNDNVCEQILGGIINGLRQTEQIAQISLQAIRDSIHFLAPILENYSYMNETFNAIQFLLSNDLGNKAYEVLFEIGKICYFLLSPFLQRLCKITIQHIKSRSVLSERAMQFWDTVATEYLIRSERNTENAYELASPVPNYILQVYSLLVTQIMSCMLITSNIDLEHPELREASVRALTSIVGCCGRQVVDVIVEGVEKIIASPLDGQRQAAVLLFSCLSDHNDRKIIKQMFQRWFQRLQSLIGDSSQIVRKNTLNGFIALSQSYPEVFIDHQQQYVFQNLLELTSHTNEDFSSLALSILYNITQYFDNNQYNNKPFPKAKLYIQFLLTRFFEDNPQRTIKYMQTIVEIAINMLTLITDDQSQAELLKFLINKYYTVNFQKILIITNILYTISSLLVRIRKNNCLLDGMLQDFNIFINDLLKRMGCSYHTFQVIGACSFLCEKKFSKISLNQNYWKCTEQGLNRYDDPILFKATMICLGDVVRNNNGKYSSKIIAISKRLIDSIHANIPYSHKYLVLRFISDFCIGLGQYAETFLDKILAICTQCFNAVYILQQSENQREHAVILKDAIVDMYHAMACNINKAGKVNLKLANHFATLSTFIVITCQQRQNPNLNYLRECVMLLFDCSIIYLNNKTIAPVVREIIYSEQIKIIINTLKLHSNCPKIQDTLQFVSTVYQKF